MEIVIEIEEKLYNTIIRSPNSPTLEWYAIAHGTVLPKGHGRLKDIDKVEQLLDLDKPDNTIAKALKNIIESVPTIIEADKENDNGIDN